MSKYKTIQTEYRTVESLRRALTDILGADDAFQIAPDYHLPTLPLEDWHGETRPEKASVRIPRFTVNRFSGGASNDVGFAWNGQSFTAIVSDYDHNERTTALLNQVRQRYAYHEITRQARSKGYTVRETRQPDGTLRLTLTHR